MKRLVSLILCLSLALSVTIAYADLSTNEQSIGEVSAESKKLSDQKIVETAKRLEVLNKKVSNGQVNPMSDPQIPPSKILSTSGYIAQPDNSTCGPTSAHNLLLSWGKNISIDTLKKDLGYNGQTPFGDAWKTMLNNYTNSTYYVVTWSPSQTTIWNAFVGDTIDGHPFILDTHMSFENGYLEGYSGSTWWHYVTGIGYSGYNLNSDNSKYGVYFDPYDGRVGTFGQHSLELPKWVKLVSERGIVW